MIANMVGGVCRVLTGGATEWHCDPDDDRPRVFFANHASHLDFVTIWSAVRRRGRGEPRPVAGSTYWNAGRVRRFMADRVFHAVLIERSPRSIGVMAAELDRHRSVILFPEGTRSRDGAIGAF